MSKAICHHNGNYNMFDLKTGRFVSPKPMTLKQIKAVVEDELNECAVDHLPIRLGRARMYGTSSLRFTSLEEMVRLTRKRLFLTVRTFETQLGEDYEQNVQLYQH